MKSTIRIILKNKIFRLLILLILILLIAQIIVATYSIADQNRLNPDKTITSISRNNISMIKMLSNYQGELLNGNIFFNFKFNAAVASFTQKPLCKTQLNQKELEEYYNNSENIKFRLWYCISVKSYKGKWLNYIIRSTLPEEKVLLFANLITAMVIVIISIFCWALLKIIIPTRKLEDNVYEVGMSLVKKEVRASGIKVLGRFANSINFIQERLFKALNIRTKMLSMIAHDLKAPIARLKLRYELGLVDYKDNLEDVELLEKLCYQILLEAKDDMFGHEVIEDINISSLLKNIINKYNNIDINIDDDICLKGRKLSLYRAFENLISNAKKYSDKVSVNIAKNDYFVEINIKDYGKGIKESEIKNIFRPFYQVNSMKEGNGLGLTIVQEIITNHNGFISISNHYEPHGVIVNVKLPV
ncbi:MULTISPECIES: sensor histidine kinase [Francisella]|uniref:histidine kinase n=1 Tax=Francisella opportunistica TaxID=2016517 RepID=A0A345JTH4_9GAMM|nr:MULTISPECIES: HAMP domain-containing sensor histidine kinase [Francisella]APC92418.1 periplasmic sensor signal transduction histidine kinase [Francisella sp. MA067296]AXH30620.1 sensor histidine kinase [Francisella opportunistica]AXH32260.1 sensor histidine kinase [Francisella opportunistica]AXH33909.1 sensor histidine kinase [Francisella opportunistica]